MGYSDAGAIEQAGTHLLGLLKVEGRVRYSRFYDGSDETHGELKKALGIEDDDDWYCPERLVDLAAWQLEVGGIVTLTTLDDLLADGEQDYLIELTDRGRSFIERGERFQFRTAE